MKSTHTLYPALLALLAASHARAQSPPARLQPPEPTVSVKANSPADALERHKEGSATVLTTIGKDGVVKAVEIAESSGDASLDQSAMSAAMQWRFKPATDNGVPIESQVRIPFHFHLAEHNANEHATPTPTPTPTPLTPPAPKPTSEPVSATPAPSPVEESAANDNRFSSNVHGKKDPPSRGVSDYHVDVEKLSFVPHVTASEFLKLAPGILLTNEGGEGHAEQVFLRGFDAREGQDIEFSIDGVPINESGNLHGNGYSDTHFIIPELIESLRVVEGPFDPRQGNYAVAGSAEYHLGLQQRGLTAKFSAGNYGSYRLLMTWAPQTGGPGTFAAVELYQTAGFGANRDGRRGTVMAQYEGRHGAVDLRLTAQAYLASFHTAGVLRDDDVRQNRIDFFGTYDTRQGEDASRYSLAFELGTRAGSISLRNLVFGIARPLRLRENFTGFLLDTQQPLQSPHGQRGDLIDLNVMEWTVGARGSARLSGVVLKQVQELELGYFARGDFVSSTQQRIEAATGHPYQTDTNLDSRLGDIGLYADANLRFLRWLALRGGVRADVFSYDVNNLCAVPITSGTLDKPDTSMSLGDVSCLSQQDIAAHREPNQRVSSIDTAILPRGSLLVGPFWGFSASGSAGTGVRSIDPDLVKQDGATPFANVNAYEAGLQFNRRFRDSIDLSVRSVFFDTKVDRELVFSQSQGRNALCGGSTRLGTANSLRFTGRFWDLAANLTWLRATFDSNETCSDQTLQTQSGNLVPYVPDLVFRADGAVFGDWPYWKSKLKNHALRGALGVGVTYVGPRPLPYGQRSDTIATLDANASIGWWFIDLSITTQNLIDTRYRLGEYNYASYFPLPGNQQPFPSLVPVRHFTAGAPRTVFFSIALNYGGNK